MEGNSNKAFRRVLVVHCSWLLLPWLWMGVSRAQIPIEGDRQILDQMLDAYREQESIMSNFDAVVSAKYFEEPFGQITAKFHVFARGDEFLIQCFELFQPGLSKTNEKQVVLERYGKGESYREFFDGFSMQLTQGHSGAALAISFFTETYRDDALGHLSVFRWLRAFDPISPQGIVSKFVIQQRDEVYAIQRTYSSGYGLEVIVDPKIGYRIRESYPTGGGRGQEFKRSWVWERNANGDYYPKSGVIESFVNFDAMKKGLPMSTRTFEVESFETVHLSPMSLAPSTRWTKSGTRIMTPQGDYYIRGGQEGEHIQAMLKSLMGIQYVPKHLRPR